MSLDARARSASRAVETRAISSGAAPDFSALLRRATAVRRRRLSMAIAGTLVVLLALTLPLWSSIVRDQYGRVVNPIGRGGVTTTPKPGGAPVRGQGLAPRVGARARLTPAAAAAPSAASLDARVLFASGPDNSYGDTDSIYVMNADGSDRERLADEGSAPALSLDRRRIVYTRFDPSCDVPSDCYEVWVMNPDGSQPHRLAQGRSPDWSPDGTRIAFWRCCEGADAAGEGGHPRVYIMKADGSGAQPLAYGVGEHPDWSPDGTEIAFSSRVGNECHRITVREVHGPGDRDLPNMGCYADFPDWSPDGTRIAVDAARGFNEYDHGIYVTSSDGSGEAKRLSPVWNGDEPRSASQPSWSSDGRQIAYTWDPDGQAGSFICKSDTVIGSQAQCRAGGPAPGEIYVMNADGSGPTRLGEGHLPDLIP